MEGICSPPGGKTVIPFRLVHGSARYGCVLTSATVGHAASHCGSKICSRIFVTPTHGRKGRAANDQIVASCGIGAPAADCAEVIQNEIMKRRKNACGSATTTNGRSANTSLHEVVGMTADQIRCRS